MRSYWFWLKLALPLMIGTVAQAAPTVTYDWSETGSSFGNGSGTLTVDATSDLGPDSGQGNFAGDGYDYTVLTLNGTFDGVAITADPSALEELNFSSASLPSGVLQNEEISLLAGPTEYDIANLDDDFPSPAYVYKNYGTDGSDAETDTFTLTPVPEPGSLALTALGGVALLGWRKRTARNAKSSQE